MKKLLIIAVVYFMQLTAHAQGLKISNNTSCDITIQVFAESALMGSSACGADIYSNQFVVPKYTVITWVDPSAFETSASSCYALPGGTCPVSGVGGWAYMAGNSTLCGTPCGTGSWSGNYPSDFTWDFANIDHASQLLGYGCLYSTTSVSACGTNTAYLVTVSPSNFTVQIY